MRKAKNNKKVFIILKNIVTCAIIFISIFYLVFAEDLSFTFKELEVNGTSYTPMTDAMAFHFSITDYGAKDGDSIGNSLHGPSIEDSNYNMQGYGRYHMQTQYQLCSFIEYCHRVYSSDVENYCQYTGSNPNDPYTYAKVVEKRGELASGDFKNTLNQFWQNMSTNHASGDNNFQDLQDKFIIERYVLPAVRKLSISSSKYKKAFNKSGSFSMSSDDVAGDNGELITALLTAIYSDFYTADLTGSGTPKANIGTGDLIPFLYNADVTGNSASDIAKYAYIAYINGFETAGRTDGFHYWEEEYEAVFGEPYDLSEEEVGKLQQKYDTMAELFSEEKGNKGSRLLGQTITTIIKSDYNIETQVSAVRAKIDNILRDFNTDTTYKELIAKNYLMVKHMMDNDHIKDTIKDYEIGTIFRNESSMSQGQFDENNTNTALLSDFQLVTVSAKNLFVGRSGDTDGDGVSDGDELGPDPRDWTDITDIIISAKKEKTLYESESEYRAREASNFEITKEEGERWEEFNDSIKVEWEDTRHTKVKKVLAKLYNYRSNPNLIDTDFDGLDDKEEKGKSPLNNNFKGSSMTTDDGDLKIDFNTDFRYLMFKDTKYNDELAQQSLIMSNLVNGKTIDIKNGSYTDNDLTLYGYMNKLGFKDILESHNEKYEEIEYKYAIGYKIIDYYGKKRGVIGIFLGGLDSKDAYNKLVLDKDYIKDNDPYNAISNVIKTKIIASNLSDLDLDYCYWISGKNIAGGVASELAKLVKEEDKDVFCYTFGAPKTHIGNNYDYDYIKNIQNEDDYITKAISDNDGYRYGYTYNGSIMHNFKYNYRNLTKNNPKYTGDYQKVNSMNYIINDIRTNASDKLNALYDDLSNLLANNNTDFSNTSNDTDIGTKITELKSYVENNELRTAKTTEAYWTLAKVLEGLDEKRTNGRKYDKKIEQASGERWDNEIVEIVDNIKDLGVWFVNHIITYQVNLREERGTTIAKQYFDDNKNENTYPMNGDGRLSDKDSETVIKKGSTKYYYFYEPFAGFETSNDEEYKENGTNRNYLKRYLGNDCSGFVQGVIYTLSEGDRGQEGDNPNVSTDTTGLWNHNVNAGKLVSDTTYDTENSMLRLGWQKYYVQGNEWKRKRMKDDGTIENKTLKEIYNNSSFNMSVGFLEPGDVLCASDHVEFYIGYEYDVIYNGKMVSGRLTRDKKYGIESLTLKKKATQGHSTFAWGNVQNEFPKQKYYFTYDGTNRVFRLNYSSTSPDGKNYKVIWRKN